MSDDAPVWPHPPGARPRTPFPLVDRLAAEWRTLLLAALAGAVLAGAVSFLLPRRYTSTATFVPEQAGGDAVPSGVSALAGQFGLALGNRSGPSPEFYSRLIRSRGVGTAVVLSPLEGGTLIDRFATGGRPDSVERAVRRLSRAVSVSVDAPTRIVRLDVELEDPELAQAVNRRILAVVDEFNSEIRRSRASERRAFAEEQYAAARDSLDVAESALRDFVSRNRLSETPELRYERERLQRAVDAAQQAYTALLGQVQQARIAEVDDTPLISVIDPPARPRRRSSPNRIVIALFGAVLAGGAAGAYTLVRRR